MNSMKKVIALLVMGLGTSVAVNAADGTITFNGAISNVTCSINGSTPNGAVNQTVNLPTVDASALTVANAVAGTTPFSITLGRAGETNCANAIARVLFESGAGVDATTGLLTNTAQGLSAARGVSIALLNADDFSQIVVGSSQPNNHASATITNNQATLNYVAAYRSSLGGLNVGSGVVTASVAYSVIYN